MQGGGSGLVMQGWDSLTVVGGGFWRGRIGHIKQKLGTTLTELSMKSIKLLQGTFPVPAESWNTTISMTSSGRENRIGQGRSWKKATGGDHEQLNSGKKKDSRISFHETQST